MTDATARQVPEVPVWDLGVRLFHWSTAILFLLDFAVLDEDWAVHAWVGYAVAALLVFRLLWGLVGPRRARFSAFPPDIDASRDELADLVAGAAPARHASHGPLGALMVYNLLLALSAICVTGIAMETDAFWGVDWLEDAHEMAANYAALSVALHILAVVLLNRFYRPGLIHGMVGAWKR